MTKRTFIKPRTSKENSKTVQISFWDKKAPLFLTIILALALAIKIGYFYFSRQIPYFEPLQLDPKYYHDWALKITRGDWVAEGVFYGLPLYPYFLGAIYKITGLAFVAAKWVQIALGLVTLFFIYKIGQKLVSHSTGLLAALLAAFYGPLFFHEQILIPETLSLPLYAAGFYFACQFFETPTLKNSLLAGVILGLATLTKAGAMLFVATFLIFLVIREIRNSKNKRYSEIFLLALFYCLTLAPVTIHNLVRGGDFVILTSHSGFNFYIGNNPQAEGVFKAPEGTGANVDAQIRDSKFVAEEAMGKPLKPSEVSKYWSDKAWQFIRQNPAHFLGLCVRKLVIFFDEREISDIDAYEFLKKFNPMLGLPWPSFALLGPLFFMGLAASFKNLKFKPIVYLWIGTYLLGMMSFFVNARYRLPLLSLFFVLAAHGVTQLFNLLKEKLWLRAFILIAACVFGIWISKLEFVGIDWTGNYVSMGDIYHDRKDFDEAIKFYSDALKLSPTNPKANLAMGTVLTRIGRYDEAKDYYMKSLESKPDAMAYNNLGLWYDREGDLEMAREYFLKALKLKPNLATAHNNLGMIYGKGGDNESARDEFEISLKLDPNSAKAHTNLGLVLYRLGDKESARRHWLIALGIDPDFSEAKKALKLST